jgi:hypothetical protein
LAYFALASVRMGMSGVGIFPEGEEILVGFAGFGCVAVSSLWLVPVACASVNVSVRAMATAILARKFRKC